MSQVAGSGGAELPELGSLRYEQLIELLEDLVRQMGSGEVGIEEAARLYEQAGVVYRVAGDRLASVTERLAAITATRPGAAEAGPAD